jgi:hypothetical protein
LSDYKIYGLLNHRQGVMRGMVLTRETNRVKRNINQSLSLIDHQSLSTNHNQKCLQNLTASKTNEKMLRKHDKLSMSSTRFPHF